MKHKIINSLMLTLAMAVITIASPPLAHADDVQNYLDALHSRGITAGHGDGTLVAVGEEVCDYIAEGHTPIDTAQQVYQETDSSISANDSGFIVGAAIANICPEYLDRV